VFYAPECPCSPAIRLMRNVSACFGLAGFCLASPLYRCSAEQWLEAGLRQLLELRSIAA
jgi:hypothetical protein